MFDRETILGAIPHWHPGYHNIVGDSWHQMPPKLYACSGKCSSTLYPGLFYHEDYWFADADVAGLTANRQVPHGHVSATVYGPDVGDCYSHRICPTGDEALAARWVSLANILAL